MFKSPTVFILGAGASAPYGYPFGRKLVDKLISELSNKNGSHFMLCLGLEFREAHILDFAKQLKLSDDDNIDAFLERIPDFVKLGKVAIALSLIEKENVNAFYTDGKDKWYRTLVNELKSSSPSNFENKVAFLTFNYDRSFDHYLFDSIRGCFHKAISDKECAEMVKTMPIIHLHGHIGKLKWQANDNEKGRPYDWHFRSLDNIRRYMNRETEGIVSAEARQDVFRISEQIKIISEAEAGDDTDFKEAHRLLSEAHKIYFLGFGYHDDNLRRLKIADLSNSVEVKDNVIVSRIIAGTAYDIGEARRNHIKSLTKGKINLSKSKILEFLKEEVDFW